MRPALRAGTLLLGALAAALLLPAPADAYVGPGAGFAFLGSFLTLLLGFLSAFFSLLTWPVRQLYRALRRRKAYGRARVQRVVILGFDGMDPELAARYMDQGRLPHLAHLRDTGTFRPLQTTFPPISPVAWSSFLTGVNPGKHNIYDFLARDCASYLPYLSSAQIRPAKRSLRIGRYLLPLGRPQTKLLRKGKPFWHFLGEAGFFSSIIRVPITFPPEKFSGVLLSGMCVPDLIGSQGTFSFHTTRPGAAPKQQGGREIPLEPQGRLFRSYVPGPDNPLRRDNPTELRVAFSLRPEPGQDLAHIDLPGQGFTLRKGEYSDWIELEFKAGLGIKVPGICRFYLKEVSPHLELYVTPVNIHPGKPALPISHPFAYSVYLAKLLGLYATLGLAEDTWALNEGVLTEEAFLQQCALLQAEREKMFFDALEKTPRGLCVCVFDITDRVQHMFWRTLEDDHPARQGSTNNHGEVIADLYRQMDDLVGRTLRQLDEESLLLVISDHGFKSFRRGVNLNSWLCQNGYLTLKKGAAPGEWFQNVDWERTRAYALGLNGLYLNQKGRERAGVVAPGQEADAVKAELRERLSGLLDPETGRVAIREVFGSGAIYHGPYRENAPDLIVGYNAGYRAAWDSVTGKVTGSVFEDNTKAWSGDHCLDPRLVPGVLFCNRKIACERPAIVDIAPTVLELFGVELPTHLDGKPWVVSDKPLP